MNTKKITLLLLLLISPLATALAQQRTLEQMIKQLDASKGLQITFEIFDPELADSVTGEYRGLGRSFHYTTEEMKAWYDGCSLWVYLDRSSEVNLSVPMKEDLMMINPLLVLDHVRSSDYTLSEKKEGDGSTTITAIPKKKAPNGLQKLVVCANKDYTPNKLYIYEAGLGTPIEVRVTGLKRGPFAGMNEKDYFRFTQNKLPGVMVIDLR